MTWVILMKKFQKSWRAFDKSRIHIMQELELEKNLFEASAQHNTHWTLGTARRV
jgi:hypothetical protein